MFWLRNKVIFYALLTKGLDRQGSGFARQNGTTKMQARTLHKVVTIQQVGTSHTGSWDFKYRKLGLYIQSSEEWPLLIHQLKLRF